MSSNNRTILRAADALTWARDPQAYQIWLHPDDAELFEEPAGWQAISGRPEDVGRGVMAIIYRSRAGMAAATSDVEAAPYRPR